MTDFTAPLLEILNGLIPFGTQYATEWYTLNEILVYFVFVSILYHWILVPVIKLPQLIFTKRGKKL